MLLKKKVLYCIYYLNTNLNEVIYLIVFLKFLFLYTLIISIDIKEGLPKTEEKPMMCDVKLKKYDLNTFEIIGQLPSPIDGDKPEYLKIEINKIDEDYLVDLKIEIDDKFGGVEEFEIETE